MRQRSLVLCIATVVAVLLLAPAADAARAPAAPRCPVSANQAGANWSKADLRDCNLAGFSFVGANLNKATLDGADLTNADVSGANTNKATCVGTIVTGLTGGPLGCAGSVDTPPLAPPAAPQAEPRLVEDTEARVAFAPVAGATSYTLTATPIAWNGGAPWNDGPQVSISGPGDPIYDVLTLGVVVTYATPLLWLPGLDGPCGVSHGFTFTLTASGPGGTSAPATGMSGEQEMDCPSIEEEA